MDLYEADTARLAAYRYYKFYSKLPVPTTAIVLHAKTQAEVSGERGTIMNMDELDAFFKKKVAVRIELIEEHRFGLIVVL